MGRIGFKKLNRANRRGTAYLLVLAITSMLVVLGFAANQIAANQIDREQLETDQANARLAASSSLDHVHKLLDGQTAWRGYINSGYWYLLRTEDDTTVYLAVIDQVDGDLSNNNAQPFLVYCMAVVNNSRRVYSVEFYSDAAGNLTMNHAKFKQSTFEEVTGG